MISCVNCHMYVCVCVCVCVCVREREREREFMYMCIFRYANSYMQPLDKKVKSYVRVTTDFLNRINSINKITKKKIPIL